ncbi:MAG: OmpA family protein [Flammeovirgaceae bacterium]
MKISLFFLIGLYFCAWESFGQCNLIRNPSFERFETAKPAQFIDQLADWKLLKPAEGGCVHPEIRFWGYDNARGEQSPVHGKGYIWLKLGGKNIGEYHSFGDVKRAYIYTELSEPMIKDSVYQVSFHVSFAEKSNLAIDKIGVHFSDSILSTDYGDFIQFFYFPHVQKIGKVLEDPHQWVKVSGAYRAKGGEKFLTLGHFGAQYRFNYTFFKKKSHFPEAFYFIDQVEVTPSKYICNPTIAASPRVEIKTDTLLTFPKVQFRTGSASLAKIAFPVLDQVVTFLNTNPNLVIEIQGHTDQIGTAAYNLKLSKMRAITVAKYIKSKGIDASRISPIGYGDTKPIASNETEAGRQQNRRVMFLIKYKL